MNNWLEGLSVTLVGMLVVFAGLLLIIAVISLIKVFGIRKALEERLTSAPAAPVPVPQPATPALIQQPGQDPALVAAITAALACVLGEEQPEQPTGFRVRRIRRVA